MQSLNTMSIRSANQGGSRPERMSAVAGTIAPASTEARGAVRGISARAANSPVERPNGGPAGALARSGARAAARGRSGSDGHVWIAR